MNYRNTIEKRVLLFTYPESTNLLNQRSEVHFVFMGCGQGFHVSCILCHLCLHYVHFTNVNVYLFKTKIKNSGNTEMLPR